MEIENQAAILGVIGGEAAQIDMAISDAAQALIASGCNILGIVQERGEDSDNRACREMRVRDLVTEQTTVISERRGKLAQGCHLDRSALLKLAKQFETRILELPDLVIINRFGRAECEGSGFRSAVELAVSLNIPVLVGVREIYEIGWHDFHGGLARNLPAEEGLIVQWFERLKA